MTYHKKPCSLEDHLKEVKSGEKKFENAFQSVSRMILSGEKPIEKIMVNGRMMPDFTIFRQAKKHLVGMHSEINDLVNYINEGARKGPSAEQAFAYIGDPGNGKTFLIEYLCDKYREFLSQDKNRKYTFRFTNLKELGTYGQISHLESQTFEDPMILAMNFFRDKNENIKLLESIGFTEKQIEELYSNYRPLGACTDYTLEEIKTFIGKEDFKKISEFIEVVPVPISPSRGIITGKYSAKDKITASGADLVGDESLVRTMNISTDHPYRIDLREGAIAKVAGGGIHFADEIFKNKPDLIQIYLGIIQDRAIDVKGFKWPIDTLIVTTSNNDEFNKFKEEASQKPIWNRFQICHMAHNTNYQLQKELTRYALGDSPRATFSGEKLHQDPNLNHALSVAVVLTRLPNSKKLTPIEMMKLGAGEIAEDKSVEALREVIDTLAQNPDSSQRFGQKGLGHRDLGRGITNLVSSPKTQEGKCMYAEDAFLSLEKIIYDYVQEDGDRKKYLGDLDIAKSVYKDEIRKNIFNAYMEEPKAIEQEVMRYVNTIIGMSGSEEESIKDKLWTYKDPQTNQIKSIKIDTKFVDSVEERMGLKTEELKKNFRNNVIQVYGKKISQDPNYNFMDNGTLVKAVTDVRLKSDVAGAGSLVGALSNRTNEENQKVYDRVTQAMIGKLGYCPTCAQKTIEYFCTHEDEK